MNMFEMINFTPIIIFVTNRDTNNYIIGSSVMGLPVKNVLMMISVFTGSMIVKNEDETYAGTNVGEECRFTKFLLYIEETSTSHVIV